MARWHSANVLQAASDKKRLWQFKVGGDTPSLSREENKLPSEASKRFERGVDPAIAGPDQAAGQTEQGGAGISVERRVPRVDEYAGQRRDVLVSARHGAVDLLERLEELRARRNQPL